MKSKLFGVLGMVVLVLMLVGALFPLATPAAADNPIKPIIFVHGSAGSGAQYESQAMRFASNGYPANYIFGFDYDSTLVTENITTVLARLDAFVDACRAQTGADKVYMLGHSMGTSVMIGSPPAIPVGYLGVPERAAKVAKYVNIDGRTAPALPGGVPTLALWATKGWSYNPANAIVGATNIFIPNQTHVQIATSAESFVEMYKFFTGNPPATNQIVPEPSGQIILSGRAVFFPQNIGVGDATLEIWKVNSSNGYRIGTVPQATYTLTGSGPGPTAGAWGPFNAEVGKNYEFVIVRTGFRPHHFYLEPFIRSDYLIRLLTSPPGGIGDLMERNLNSAALVISRNKEFWGQGDDNDVLTINGTNIINAATCPIIKVPGFTGVIGIFAYDRYLNTITDLSAPIPVFFATGFMTGVDIFIPAADPPNGTIFLVLTPRGGGGQTQVVNIANWASLNHSVSIPFNDFLQPAEEEVIVPQVVTPKASPSLPPLRLPSPNVQLNSISVSPGQTQAGQPVTVLANVVNSGASRGSYNVAVRINGKVEQQRTIEVSPGTAYPVRFTVTKSEPGTYDVAIENQSASFTVLGGGTTSKAPASGGLIAVIAMAVLILATAVVLMISFRRPA